MAFTASERSICNKVVFDFDAIVAPVRMGKAFVQNSTSAIQGLLNTTSFASEAAINAAITAFGDAVQENLPDTSELVEISHLIRHCDYLHDIAPVAIIATALDSAVGKIDTLADEVGLLFPEFNMGKLASSINDLLFGNIPGSSIVSELMQKGDKIIDCISAYCGGEYPAQVLSFVDTMNELYEDLNIIDDPIDPNYGTYDMDSLYAGAGISPQNRINVNNVIGAQDGAKNLAIAKIDSVIGAMKTFSF
jgi:hypothetical protein